MALCKKNAILYGILVCFALFSSGEVWAFGHTVENIGVSVQIGTPPPPPPPPPASIDLGGPSIPFPGVGIVVVQGKAYPKALVSIERGGAVTATTIAKEDGTFETTLTGVSTGLHTFVVYAQDAAGNFSGSVRAIVTIFPDTITTISGLFLPPTMSVPALVQRNARVPIQGYSFPTSQVSLFFRPDIGVKQAKAADDGAWNYELSASVLQERTYEVRAKAFLDSGQQSDFTTWKTFRVLPFDCAHGDLNGDGKVDMQDLSILLFWWEQFAECPDQNKDGIVDMIDASILFFWWTS